MEQPFSQRAFIDQNLPAIKSDQRFIGVAVGGSYLSNQMDDYSDLDLIIVVDDYHHPHVMMEREEIVSHFGQLLASYTGDPAGDPNQITCLYEKPLLHVDVLFCRLDHFKHHRQEDPEILWERGHRLSRTLLSHPMSWDQFDPQWLEDRFWLWTHYLAAKLARGEIFEVIDGLSFVRVQVLAPLARFNQGMTPRGVRFLETALPGLYGEFCETVPKGCSVEAARHALNACVELYTELREQLAVGIHRRRKAEKAVLTFLEQVSCRQVAY